MTTFKEYAENALKEAESLLTTSLDIERHFINLGDYKNAEKIKPIITAFTERHNQANNYANMVKEMNWSDFSTDVMYEGEPV